MILKIQRMFLKNFFLFGVLLLPWFSTLSQELTIATESEVQPPPPSLQKNPFLVSEKELPFGELQSTIPQGELAFAYGDGSFVHPESVFATRYSTDGNSIYTGGEKFLLARSATTGEEIWHTMEFQQIHVIEPLRTQDLLLVGTYPGDVFLVSTKDGTLVRKLGSVGTFVNSLALTHDEKIAAAATLNGKLGIWNLSTGTPITFPELPDYSRIDDILFLDQKTLILGCADTSPNRHGYLSLLDLKSSEIKPLLVGSNDSFPISLNLSKDGKQLFVGYWKGNLEIRDPRTLDQISSLSAQKYWAGPILIPPQKDHLIISSGQGIVDYNLDSNVNRLVYDTTAVNHTVQDCTLSPTGDRLLISRMPHNRVHQLSTSTFDEIYPSLFLEAPANILAFSADGDTLALASRDSKNCLFWSTKSRSFTSRLTLEHDQIGFRQIAFSPKGNYFASATNYTSGVTVYTWPELKISHVRNIPTNGTFWFDPEDRLIFILESGKRIPSVLSLETGKAISNPIFEQLKETRPELLDPLSLLPEDEQQNSWGFQPLIAANHINFDSKKFSIWKFNHKTQKDIIDYWNFGGFSEQMEYYGGITNDQRLLVVNSSTGNTVSGVTIRGYKPRRVAISPDGKMVAVAGWDNILRIYLMPLQ